MRVPVLEMPDVAPRTTPDVGVGLNNLGEAFGQPMARALQQVGGAADRVADVGVEYYRKQRDEARAIAAADAQNDFHGAINNRLYDPQNGLMNQRGDAAFQSADSLHDDLTKERDAIADRLTDPEVRQTFMLHAGGAMEEANKQVNSHLSQQVEAKREAALALAKQNALTSLSNTFTGDFEKDQELRQRAMVSADSMIKALSRSDEEYQLRLNEFRRDEHAVNIDGYLSRNDPANAKAYFYSTFKDRDGKQDPGSVAEMLGPRQDEFRKRIQEQDNHMSADATAQKLVGENLDENGRPIEGKVWAEVDKEPPGPKRQMLEQQVGLHLNHQMKAYEQAEGDRLGRVVTDIESSGGNLDPSTDDFQRLSPADRAKAWERRNSLLRTDRAAQHNDDREELARFSALPREDQASINVNTQFPAASQTARYQMQAQQKNIKDRIQKAQIEPIKEFDEQVRAVSEQMNLPKKDANDLKAQLDDWYLHAAKPPTRPEVEHEISSRLQLSKGGLFGFGRKFQFQTKPGEAFEPGGNQPYDQVTGRQGGTLAPAQGAAPSSTIGTQNSSANLQTTIPKAFVDQVTAQAMKTKGRPPTASEIMDLYEKFGKAK